MWCSWWSLCVLVMVLDVTESQTCDSGWFGPKCEYKCHCTSTTCDVRTGECTGQDSTCDKGWFGPACQYSDLTRLGQVQETDQSTVPIPELSDGDDNSCYTNTILSSAVVTWNLAHHFTWMRVVVKEGVFDTKFSVKLKNETDPSVSCDNVRQWMVNSRTVDIHCDLSRTTQQVILTWDGDVTLCSLHVSGGRNIALKQTASQTSTASYDAGRIITSAFKAVDGRTLSSTDHCSSTRLAKGPPFVDPNPAWNVTLSRPQLVYRFVIYGGFPEYDNLLQGFTLTSFGQDNTTLFSYTDKEETVQHVYTIVHGPQGQPVTSIQISGQQHGEYKAVPLCEVEVYGESICEAGMYGVDCDQNCNCAVDGEACFVSTGGCPSGCPPGLYGGGCHTECPPKYYGVECRESCSTYCLNQLCNKVDGQCSNGCVPEYQGDLCEESTCDSGFYGVGCIKRCSENCGGDGSCGPENGTCVHGCVAGYTTLQCTQTCDFNKYGEDCKFDCSQFCQKDETADQGSSVCNHVTGTCRFGCQEGYHGPECQETTSTSDSGSGVAIGVGVGLGLLAIIIIVIVIVVYIFRVRRKSTGAGLPQPHYEDVTPVQFDPNHYNEMYTRSDRDDPTEPRYILPTFIEPQDYKYENTSQTQSADVEENPYDYPSDYHTSDL